MTVTMTQKVIKIGTSAGVIIPAKDLKRAGVKPGREVKLSFEPVEEVNADKVELVELTQKLIARHKTALKNLSQR
jgi:antitoxin component of MazEF toxin-antitoxin module